MWIAQQRQPEQAGKDDDERHHHFEGRPNNWRELRRAQIFRSQDALNYQEVGSPVPHRDDGTQSKNNADPIDPHRIVSKVAQGGPQMGIRAGVWHVLLSEILQDPRLQTAPASGFQQSQDRYQQRARPDQKELEDLIENRGPQAAEGYVDRNRD